MLTNSAMMHVAHVSGVEALAILKKFEDAAAGRKVRILSDYNGQSFGSSKPSQRGSVCTVKQAKWHNGDWSLQLDEWAYGHPFIALNEVEFL